jgi:hypothetical protein
MCCIMKNKGQWAILDFTPSPQGWTSPQGWDLSFWGMFTHRGEHSLLLRGMEGWTENFTPRGQLRRWGQSLPLGAKLRTGLSLACRPKLLCIFSLTNNVCRYVSSANMTPADKWINQPFADRVTKKAFSWSCPVKRNGPRNWLFMTKSNWTNSSTIKSNRTKY